MASGTDIDGYSTITGRTLRIAIDELNEDPATRGSKVKELRARIIQREAELQVSVLEQFKCSVVVGEMTYSILKTCLSLFSFIIKNRRNRS